MATEKDPFVTAATLRKEILRSKRDEALARGKTFLGALSVIGSNMADLLEPENVAALRDAAKPLNGEPMFGRSQAVGYWLSKSPSAPMRTNETRDMPFRGIFRGVEVVHESGVRYEADLDSLCLVLDAFRKGRPGDYTYSSRSNLNRRVEYIEPVTNRLWVPVSPVTHLSIEVKHFDQAISAIDTALEKVANADMVLPQFTHLPDPMD